MKYVLGLQTKHEEETCFQRSETPSYPFSKKKGLLNFIWGSKTMKLVLFFK